MIGHSRRSQHTSSRSTWWIVGGVVAIAAGLLAWGNLSSTALTNRQLALSCTSDPLTQFHIHPYLTIIVNGATQTIPADIGVSLACMHPLHTHDDSGEIHIESPQARDFTLGDFFAVWGEPFSATRILGYAADASRTITMTVNGTPADTYENTVLRDGDHIVISYGPRT